MTVRSLPRSTLVALIGLWAALTLPVTASAQGFLFGDAFGLTCGLSNSEPTPIATSDSGPFKLASLNVATAILADDDRDGKTKVSHTVTMRVFDQKGSLDWKAPPYKLTSDEFALPLNGPGYDRVTPAVFPDVTSHLAVEPPFGFECIGVGTAIHNGKYYVVMAIGTTASDGTAVAPEDLSRVDLVVMNADNGSIVHTHKIRPKRGWFLSGLVGGATIFDTDRDDNSEVVISRVRGLEGGVKAEFLYEIFNLINGSREQRFKITQSNNQTNANPELPFAE